MGAPSLIAAQAAAILGMLNAIAAFLYTSVSQGGAVLAPTTASTQATGAGGVLALRVNLTDHLIATINGVQHELAAAADTVLHNAAFWSATSGKSAIWAVVLSSGTANDTPAYADVAGAEAATGSQVAPTDAEITASLGHSNWVRLADVTVNRTADTTVTQSQDNTVRPAVVEYAGNLAETESEFQP